MSSETPVNSGCNCRAGAVLMASGTGERFGSNKLLADFWGVPLFLWALDSVPDGLFERVAVVTAYPEVGAAARERGFTVVENNAPDAGQANSIRLGVETMDGLDACMFCACDQPFMSPVSMRRLTEHFDGGIVAMRFGGRIGNPVLFGSRFFHDLAALSPLQTGSAVIRRHVSELSFVEAECAVELEDVDSVEELNALQGVHSIFVTGTRNAGKSWMLRESLDALGLQPTGFLTLPYELEGEYTGYYIHSLSDLVTRQENNKPISVYVPADACIPIPETFTVFGTQYLGYAMLDDAPIVLMDELGVLESRSDDFRESVAAVLSEAKPVVGALRDQRNLWTEELCWRPDTLVTRVLVDHREECSAHFNRMLRGMTRDLFAGD